MTVPFRTRLFNVPAIVVSTLAAAVVPVAASAQEPPVPLVVVSAGGGWQAKPPGFSEQTTRPLYVETARFDSRYRPRDTTLFDVGGRVRIWRELWAGAAVTRSSRRHGVSVSGMLPHPFRFDDLRNIDGTREDLTREVTGVHVQAGWRVLTYGRIDVVVSGGPSWFSISQDLVREVDFDEEYPYDVATYTGVRLSNSSRSATGFNVGFDLTYRIWRGVGVGWQLRHAVTSVALEPGDGRSVSVDVGGTQTSAGVRLAF